MIKEVMHWTKKQLSIYLIRTTLPMKHLCHHVLLEYESLKVVLDDAIVNVLVLVNVLLQINVQVDVQVDGIHLHIVEVHCAIERPSQIEI